ncbi:hypothetical protein [Nocardia bhagyanarayanae]|uniref:hypothetical protein n=1 Tax=Nocardia bhagyanarayanae TaxID=1215925 RepID=UPI0011549CB2|nr:hypothetical protein [Nocardia bhagyanarayanae]
MEFMRDRTTVLRALIELNSNARAAIGEPFLDDGAPIRRCRRWRKVSARAEQRANAAISMPM